VTLSELHPDELLMREASSTLTPREWADLSAHLERCPACALERSVRREAARVRVPSDLDHAIAARVVGRLLAAEERDVAPIKRRGTGGRRLAYAALVLVLVSGTAMAGAALVVQIRQREAVRLESESRRALPVRSAPKRHRAMVTPTDRRQPEDLAQGQEEDAAPSMGPSLVASAESPTARPAPAPAPVEPTPVAPAVAPRQDTAGGRSAAVINRHRSSVGRADGVRIDAATLLSQAEEAESAGRTAGASRLYGELGRSFPGTREEIVARALHGQLLLDRIGNPTRALALFEAYLNAQPTGTLAEEARLGRARSLERLGRSSDERAAWLDLLRAHPRSVHAAAARARLAALDTP